MRRNLVLQCLKLCILFLVFFLQKPLDQFLNLVEHMVEGIGKPADFILAHHLGTHLQLSLGNLLHG